jgi:hypothetical protein
MADIFSNQSIQNFYQTAFRKDFARKNLFRVLGIDTGFSDISFNESDLVYITSTKLPQRAISNIPVKFMGMDFNLPGTANYPGSANWSVNFRMPQDLSIREKLEKWTRRIFDDETSTGSYELPQGVIRLALMNKDGRPMRIYRLIGAYCVSLGDYNLDITDNGGVVEQSATIAYQYWNAESVVF